MITKWKLSNFKSVRNLTELDLGQLTILAGSNSSGKSSIIQSMLLISQTLFSRVSTRSVVLNGSIVKLGQFDDLRSYGSDINQILIGWEIEPRNTRETARRSMPPNRYLRFGDEIRKVNCELAFDANTLGVDKDIFQLQPRLFSHFMNWTTVNVEREASHSISIHRIEDRINKMDVNNKIKTENELYLQALDYDVTIDSESQENITREYRSSIPVGVQLRHFLPTRVLVSYNETEIIAGAIASMICGRNEAQQIYLQSPNRDIRDNLKKILNSNFQFEISASLIKLLKDHLGSSWNSVSTQEENDPISLELFLERIRQLDKSSQKELMQKLGNKKINQEIRQTILNDLGENWKLSFSRSLSDLSEVTQYIEEFFSSSIKYLGPLRDEPRPLYPLATSNDPIDIGIKGEHTAAVFDLNKDRIITYIPTEGFKSPAVHPHITSRTLKSATIEWLKYLDVAVDVKTHDLGKIGHELKVITNDTSKEQDLTHVGVGVSQVLPILVMCLLADPDSTIVIEQPELHLHPKVQTLLADFFLSMALLGKQCIIETHSEYIINRLRFRTAAAEAEEISSLMKIYFVEKKLGASAFRPVDVNKYGAIADWPDGFFDQSQSEAEEILRAATMKLKKEKGSK
jgi:predicted ATPase